MLQYFVRNAYEPAFAGENQPRLFFASRVGYGDNSFSRTMHSHNDYAEILLVRAGTAEYLVGDRRRYICPGDLIVHNSGIIHDESPWAGREIRIYCLGVGGLALPGLRPNAFLPDDVSPVFSSGDAFPELETLCGMIYGALQKGGAARERYAQALLEAFLLRFLPLLPGAPADLPAPAPKPDRVLGARIKAYLDQHYAEDLHIPEIAAALHLSAPYLSHIFRKLYGYSPMNYLLRRRIGEAQTLLISTGLPVTEIGERVGYETTSYFSAQFAKHTGMSPKEYRKRYAGKSEGE